MNERARVCICIRRLTRNDGRKRDDANEDQVKHTHTHSNKQFSNGSESFWFSSTYRQNQNRSAYQQCHHRLIENRNGKVEIDKQKKKNYENDIHITINVRVCGQT